MALSRRSGGRSRLTIALLVLTSLALLTLDFRDAAIVQSARRTAGNVFSPLRGAAETVSEPFSNAWNGITDYGDLQSENEELRRQIEELEGRPVLEEDAAQQLAELLEQQDLEWVGAIPTTATRVLSGSPSNFSHTVDITKGSNDGIKVGMPVVNGAGLVGRVVLVTNDRSTVQLITDPDFAVGVRLLVVPGHRDRPRPGQRRGPHRRHATSNPTPTISPSRAPRVTTSGIDRAAFPASIPVGKVRSINESSGGLTIDLVIRPMADTENLAFLTVLLWEAAGMIPPSPLTVAFRTLLILVLVLTIQLGFAPGLELFGVQADLLLLVAICGGIAAGPDRGAAIGFAAGLCYDLFLQTPFGLSALTYAIIAYLVGGLQDSVLRAAWWIPVVTATAASMVGVILYGVVGTVLGGELIGLELLRIALLVGLLNTIAAPLVVRGMRWATGGTANVRARAVYR